MQIRLTVLGPRSGHQTATCDVLVTAPAGTALAAVASGLAATVGGPDTGGTVILYAGQERLDLQRRILGEPPLVDGAVLALHAPVADEDPAAGAAAELHVVAGPDAGGVHLLHGGQIRIGRSADADVPLDDPDVSRLHCAVTVSEDGRVTVADLGSTNGTTLDGTPLGTRPVPLPPGALLRVGESTLRLRPAGPAGTRAVTPDSEGHLRLAAPAGAPAQAPVPEPHGQGHGSARGPEGYVPAARRHPDTGPGPEAEPEGHVRPRYGTVSSPTHHVGPAAEGPAAAGHPAPGPAPAPAPAPAPGAPYAPAGAQHAPGRYDGGAAPHGRAPAAPAPYASQAAPAAPVAPAAPGPYDDPAAALADAPGPSPDPGARRRRGLGAWARRWAGRDGQEEQTPGGGSGHPAAPRTPAADGRPDPAELLLAALGPGPRLWERDPAHPEALEVRLGQGAAVRLRATGSLALAGPRTRLAGLARSVLAQLAALHAPGGLEIVLVSTDRARPLAERRAEWSWLGWLPHVRPAHGQDCRLLLAYDKDQATARTAELTRRLDEGPLGRHWASQPREAVAEAAAAYSGPYTVLVLDGDPGPGPLRDTVARLAGHGPAVGIHLLCLAEAPAASPASPVSETFETACAASPAFRECGTAALLSGDVATALRVLPVRGGRPAGHGEVVTADAVSAAWAERFARALAPLRADAGDQEPRRRTAASLPHSARLLDELGLARATPASLMARWAAATDQGQTVGGHAEVVLGTGRGGPVGVELVAEGPHLLVEGPPGSGRTELLRAVAASLSAASRPDRLGLVLLDGAGGERGEGLAPCTELPHVSAHLVASDPLRMREFAQALGAELKRRSELLDGTAFAEWHARLGEVSPAVAGAAPGRVVAPRQPSPAELRGDLDPARTGTLRLRSSTVRAEPAGPSPLPRLVVVVDDLDALVAPALGSTGRPAAGSVVRALEAVAREGARLGVHLVASTARPDRTAETELARAATVRVELEPAPAGTGPDQPSPGRGLLRHADGRTTPFQGGRVTGRIPRTATLRPTVVPVEWERMGDPPARRPVRELGNGPTDLALLASALDRASQLVSAVPVLFPAAP
ncbi:FHA domain-containing protein [Streptomyces sp. NPDC101132]|uniref:FHA domain-containing protein n=1 Tax=Streptomyces sp. NPDC101132 TaxID=3366110 RepID=UPI003814D853